MGKLYHYCSNEKFFNIIKTKTIRLSDISKSNDYLELKLLNDGIFEAIWKKYNDEPFSLEYNDLYDEDALKELLEEAEQILERDIETGRLTSFVICFSEKGDLLSQWRGYANNAKGVALGFETNILREYVDKTEGFLKLQPVRYVTREEIRDIFDKYAEEILEELKGLREFIATEMTQEKEDVEGLMRFNFMGMIQSVITESITLKMDSFNEEKEWRLFVPSIKLKAFIADFREDGNYGTLNKKAIKEVRDRIDFNCTENDIIPFITLKFNEIINDEKKIAFNNIIIGPNNNITEKDMSLYLYFNEFEGIKIEWSSISYR